MEPGEETTVHDRESELKCSNGHADLARDGHRPRKNREDAQRYKCKICKERVTGGDVGFKGRHYASALILLAISLFAVGNSPGVISLLLEQNMNTSVHRTTIHRWTVYYVSLVDMYTRTLPIKAGGKWSADEKYLKILGKGHWLFSVIDSHTRFLLAWKVGTRKKGAGVIRLFKEASKRAGSTPLIFCSDSLPSYQKAFNEVFKKLNPNAMHWRDCHLRGIYKNNNPQERANGTFGELIRTYRGPKSSESVLIMASLIHYNFIRPHEGLGNKTPAAAANIVIEGHNTWRTLIQNATLAAA